MPSSLAHTYRPQSCSNCPPSLHTLLPGFPPCLHTHRPHSHLARGEEALDLVTVELPLVNCGLGLQRDAVGPAHVSMHRVVWLRQLPLGGCGLGLWRDVACLHERVHACVCLHSSSSLGNCLKVGGCLAHAAVVPCMHACMHDGSALRGQDQDVGVSRIRMACVRAL